MYGQSLVKMPIPGLQVSPKGGETWTATARIGRTYPVLLFDFPEFQSKYITVLLPRLTFVYRCQSTEASYHIMSPTRLYTVPMTR